MLLELVDGGILDIQSDQLSYGGCETCNYGSSYIDNVEIYMTTGNIKIETDQMYEYALSDGYMIKLFLSNVNIIEKMTEDQFFKWLNSQLSIKFGELLKVCSF